MEAAGVGADKLGERPVEGGAAADGGMRVPLERRLVHRHHHPRRRRRVRHCSARTPQSLGLPSSARRREVLGEILSRGQAALNFARNTLLPKKTSCCPISFFKKKLSASQVKLQPIKLKKVIRLIIHSCLDLQNESLL